MVAEKEKGGFPLSVFVLMVVPSTASVSVPVGAGPGRLVLRVMETVNGAATRWLLLPPATVTWGFSLRYYGDVEDALAGLIGCISGILCGHLHGARLGEQYWAMKQNRP